MALSEDVVSSMADELLRGIPKDDWIEVGRAVFGALRGLEALQQGGEDVEPTRELPMIIGSIIEKLGQPAIESADQAAIFGMSVRPLHRALGEAWLASHPAERRQLENEVAADHLHAIVAGRFIHDEIDQLQPRLPRKDVRFVAVRDEEAGVWTATSEERITSEAETIDALMARLAEIVPEVLQSRHGLSGPLRLIIEWEEVPGDTGRKTLAVA